MPSCPPPESSIPSGTYRFSTSAGSWTPGQQHRLSGMLAVDVGEYYDGTRKTASVNARFGATNQFGVEPNISLNWLDRAGADATVRWSAPARPTP